MYKCFALTIIGVFAVITYRPSASAQQYCRTPYGTSGLCIPNDRCQYVVDALNKYGENLPNNLLRFLLRSRCRGSDPRRTYICCDASEIIRQPQTTTRRTTTATTTRKPTRKWGFTRPSFTGPDQLSVDSNIGSDYVRSLNPRGVSILENTKCGDASTVRVKNGNITKLFEYPWMVLLQYDNEGYQFNCGGSLITDQHVLTAAHCVRGWRGSPVSARLGEHNIDTKVDCEFWGPAEVCAPPSEDIPIENIAVHPDYSEVEMLNDVAIIKLKLPVKFKRHIKPICLPITEVSKNVDSIEDFFIAGWGTTEKSQTSKVLLQALLPAQKRQYCQSIFTRNTFTRNHLCVGGGGQDSSTCGGDSGGPLFNAALYRDEIKRYVQYGIVSFGYEYCASEKTYPVIFANVVELMPWITSNLN